jgi:hypothetical protein
MILQGCAFRGFPTVTYCYIVICRELSAEVFRLGAFKTRRNPIVSQKIYRMLPPLKFRNDEVVLNATHYFEFHSAALAV